MKEKFQFLLEENCDIRCCDNNKISSEVKSIKDKMMMLILYNKVKSNKKWKKNENDENICVVIKIKGRNTLNNTKENKKDVFHFLLFNYGNYNFWWMF